MAVFTIHYINHSGNLIIIYQSTLVLYEGGAEGVRSPAGELEYWGWGGRQETGIDLLETE